MEYMNVWLVRNGKWDHNRHGKKIEWTCHLQMDFCPMLLPVRIKEFLDTDIYFLSGMSFDLGIFVDRQVVIVKPQTHCTHCVLVEQLITS